MDEDSEPITLEEFRQQNEERRAINTELNVINQIYQAKINKPFSLPVPLAATQRSPYIQYMKAL